MLLDSPKMLLQADTFNRIFGESEQHRMLLFVSMICADTFVFVDVFKQSPRRNCCRVLPTNKNDTLLIDVGECRNGEPF